MYVACSIVCVHTYVGWVCQSLPGQFTIWQCVVVHHGTGHWSDAQVWCPTNCQFFLVCHCVSPHFVGSFPNFLLDEYGILSTNTMPSIMPCNSRPTSPTVSGCKLSGLRFNLRVSCPYRGVWPLREGSSCGRIQKLLGTSLWHIIIASYQHSTTTSYLQQSMIVEFGGANGNLVVVCGWAFRLPLKYYHSVSF